jgi:hypothetical protein
VTILALLRLKSTISYSSLVVYVLDPKVRRDSLQIQADYELTGSASRWGSL